MSEPAEGQLNVLRQGIAAVVKVIGQIRPNMDIEERLPPGCFKTGF